MHPTENETPQPQVCNGYLRPSAQDVIDGKINNLQERINTLTVLRNMLPVKPTPEQDAAVFQILVAMN